MPLAGLRPLRRRAFALCWAAGATSDLGTWMQLATIGSIVAASSGSALSTAMVAAATFAPQGLCSPVGGVLADRFDRRRLFLVTLAVQTVMTSLIAAALFAGERDAVVLSLMVMVQSGAGATGAPALQAILPDLVPREQLTAAVSLGILGWNVGRILGPVLAAALVPIGAGWAIGANAVSFAVLLVAVFALRRPFRPPVRAGAPLGAELLAGARALVRTRSVVLALATLVALHFTFVPFMGLMPSTAALLVERGGGIAGDASVATAASRLMSAQGIGAVVGALALASLLGRARRSSLITVYLLAVAALLPLHAVVPLPVAMVVVAGIGAGAASMFAAFGGVVQRDAPAAHRGRVLSWYQGAIGLAYGLALWLQGSFADRYGLVPLFAIGGALTAVVVVVARRTPGWVAAMDHEVRDDAAAGQLASTRPPAEPALA